MISSAIQMQGAPAYSGWVSRNGRASLTMVPHDAVGTVMPMPRKLKPLSIMMVMPMVWVAIMMMGEILLGRTCLMRIFRGCSPSNLAERIYSLLMVDSEEARIMRIKPGMVEIPIMQAMEATLRP